MRVLIVGLGSIAKKHMQALKKLDNTIEFMALRSSINSVKSEGVEDVYDLTKIGDVDFAIISNPTSEHANTIAQLVPLQIPLFIEKPPVNSIEAGLRVGAGLEKHRTLNYVAFNLRFHPVIEWLKKETASLRICEVQVYCGSYLPDWRPGVDYKKVYSAQSALGGGVHLDLIHEIDYTTWLFGVPDKSSSIRKKVSDLEINSDDYAHYIFEYANKIITISLNYFRRDYSRTITIVHADGTWIADLVNGTVKASDGNILFSSQFAMNSTYQAQMKYFVDCVKERKQPMNHFKEALKTLEICLQ